MTDIENHYQPVPCAVYSEYELAIIRQQLLRLVWRDTQRLQHIERLLPLDLKTEQQAEYLYAKNSRGDKLKIRLDYIEQYRILD